MMIHIALCVALGLSNALATDVVVPPQQVKVRSVLKETPSPFGAVVGTIEAGENVQVLERSGAWERIAAPNGAALGWVHSSAVTRQTVGLLPGPLTGSQGTLENPQVDATSDELALAGRGFNSDIESSFQESETQLPFDQIDAMEATVVSVEQARTFLIEGGLMNVDDDSATDTHSAEPSAAGGE